MSSKKKLSSRKRPVMTSKVETDKGKTSNITVFDDIPLDVHPHIVKFGLGLTLNMDGYEYIRIDVGIEAPSKAKNIDKTYKKAVSVVEAEMDKQITRLKDKYT